MPDNANSSTAPDEHFEKVLAEILLDEEGGKPLNLSRAARAHPELEEPLRKYFRDRDIWRLFVSRPFCRHSR
jgi:hypothetical protein